MAKEQEGPSRTTVGICAILVGWTGIHRFMLGDTTGGIIRIFICCTPVSLIEGIIYLMKTDEEFHQTYVVEKKAWF